MSPHVTANNNTTSHDAPFPVSLFSLTGSCRSCSAVSSQAQGRYSQVSLFIFKRQSLNKGQAVELAGEGPGEAHLDSSWPHLAGVGTTGKEDEEAVVLFPHRSGDRAATIHHPYPLCLLTVLVLHHRQQGLSIDTSAATLHNWECY